jgi:Kef-type K+ transport system membrane component KefB
MTKLVLQLAFVIVTAKLLGWFFPRFLKLPKVLGELVSGMIIGPYALGGISLEILHGPIFHIPPGGELAVTPELYGFAVVASIVLLFFSGLETDLPTFIRFSAKGSVVGLGGVIVSFVFGDFLTVLLMPQVHSFMDPEALFLGTLCTATSVGITARILSEKKKMSSPEGVTILAAAVLDDVLGIVLLAVVVGISKVSTTHGPIPWGHIGIIALKAFGFWIASTVIGIIVAPRITKGLKRFKSMDMIASISFGIALLLSGLAELAGLAMIIGAYVIGLALSQTDISHEIQKKLHGIYEFFVPVFFSVMGMMVNFQAMRGIWAFGLIFSFVAILGKMIGCGVPAFFAGFNLRGVFRIGCGMLPRGEVTLIVAGIGLSSGAIGHDLFGVSIMTLLVASVVAPPLLIKSFDGGSGYRKKFATAKEHHIQTIELSFPTQRMSRFILELILDSFRNEEFFVKQMDSAKDIYQVRKDELNITVILQESTLTVNTPPEHEQFVRLLMLEEVLVLKDFLGGLEGMKSPDMMGAEILRGMFSSVPAVEKPLES